VAFGDNGLRIREKATLSPVDFCKTDRHEDTQDVRLQARYKVFPKGRQPCRAIPVLNFPMNLPILITHATKIMQQTIPRLSNLKFLYLMIQTWRLPELLRWKKWFHAMKIH